MCRHYEYIVVSAVICSMCGLAASSDMMLLGSGFPASVACLGWAKCSVRPLFAHVSVMITSPLFKRVLCFGFVQWALPGCCCVVD